MAQPRDSTFPVMIRNTTSDFLYGNVLAVLPWLAVANIYVYLFASQSAAEGVLTELLDGSLGQGAIH